MASSARIDELLKKFEENPRRYFAPLANEYRKAGDVERAIQLCREHLPQQPGHMSGHIVFGQALFEAHQLEESRQVFAAALALDPENLIALRHLGDIARSEGDLDAARDWYKRVLDADPRNEEVGALLTAVDADVAAGVATPSVGDAGPDEEAPATDAITPIHVSSGTFAAVTRADDQAPPAAAASSASDAPAAPTTQAPAAMSAMDFALSSITPDAPGGGNRDEREERPAAESGFPALDLDAMVAGSDEKSHDQSAFDAAYATGGLGGGDEIELTPAHGASALVSRAEEPDPATTFDLSALGGDQDRSPLELADDFPQIVDNVREAPVAVGPESPAPEPSGQTAAPAPSLAEATAPPATKPPAMDDRPLGLESMEFVPPPRDAVPEPMQGHILREEEPSAATPAAFVTETMAELYLQQGFRDEALSVYRQLLAQSPADENLRDRVAQLESGSRSSVSVAGISDTVIEAARQRQTAPAPKKSAREFFAALASWRPAPVGDRASATQSADADVPWIVPPEAAPAASPAEARQGDGEAAVDEFGFPVNFDSSTAVVHRDLGAPRLEEEPRGVDLGAALIDDGMSLDDADTLPPSAAIEPATLDYAADASATPARVDEPEAAVSMSGFEVVAPEEMTGDRYGQTDAHDAVAERGDESSFAPAPGVARLSGPVDTLFGDGAVPSRDEAAASALASAFGAEPAPSGAAPAPGAGAGSTTGAGARRPTGEGPRNSGAQPAATAARPAGSELSLDHVFRETPRRGSERRREAPAFSFDQFFSDGGTARPTPESAAAPAPSEELASRDEGADIEQFNAWLEGLKKK